MTAKKRNALIIAAVVVVLAAVIAVLAILNKPKGEINSGTVTLLHAGETVKVFTSEEIEALPYAEVYKEIVSSSHDDAAGTFRGVWLHDLLDAADPSLRDGARQIVVTSEDAFVAAYTAEDVYDYDDIMLAYRMDGEPLKSKDDGGFGPFRIIILGDEFGNRSAKYVFQIEVR